MARGSRNGTRVVDLDTEDSVGSTGTFGKVVSVAATVRESRPRKSADEHPKCPHCGAKMHWNQAGATINFECLWRQFCIGTGRMDSPNDRLPVFQDEDLEPFTEWKNTRKKSRKNPLAYGKMPSATGGAATYSALRQASKPVESAEAKAKAIKAPAKTKAAKADVAADPLVAKRLARKAKQAETPTVAASKAKAPKPKATAAAKVFSFDEEDEPEVKVKSKGKKKKSKGK